MTHIARGVDKNGILNIDVIVNGDVPTLPPKAKIVVLPYVEDYLQTGPGTFFANIMVSQALRHKEAETSRQTQNHEISSFQEQFTRTRPECSE